MKILIIGAGLFGTTTAFTLSNKNNLVDLIEENDDILQGASYVNHNRIHLGYHYLRSIETAEQSIEGLLSFLFTFGNAVKYQFPNYYALANKESKTTPQQFVEFCNKVGIGYEEEYPKNEILNRNEIEASFRVPEPIWDFKTVKSIVEQHLKLSGVNVFLGSQCRSIRKLENGAFEVKINDNIKYYDIVVNATYTNINDINLFLGLAKQKLLFEDVLIPIFHYSSDPFGLTIMDGQFCSIMPNGFNSNEFLLYHVKESVLQSEISDTNPQFDTKMIEVNKSVLDSIYKKSKVFMPFLGEVKHLNYRRTTRTVFENSDDARLSEIYTYPDIPNYFSILSGKVTTCMQVALEIKHKIQGKANSKRFKI